MRHAVRLSWMFLLSIACWCGTWATSAALAGDASSPVLFPANGAAGVCADVPLSITFASPVKLGTGKIAVMDAATNQPVETIDEAAGAQTKTIGGLAGFHYYPVTIHSNVATLHLHDLLAYGKTYYVTVDPKAFDDGGNDFAGISDAKGWQFTTKTSPPASGLTKITVAADGSGDFCTVQAALDSVPDENTTPTTILLRKGTYEEIVYFANKNAITLMGEDRAASVIEYANNNKFNNVPGTYHRGVFEVQRCKDFVLANLTIRNTTPRGGSQAEAIIFNGTTKAQAIVTHVDLFSTQDTLQINGQAYLSDCYIEGDVDFMWGTGPCFFEKCDCKSTRSGAYFTQIRNRATNHGYVYDQCTFEGSPGITNMKLARIDGNVFPDSEVVLLNCVLKDGVVGPAGWLVTRGKPVAKKPKKTMSATMASTMESETPPKPIAALTAATAPAATMPALNIHFWEFNSRDENGKPVDVSQRLAISKQLTQPADAETIANYSDPTFVLGNDWKPLTAAIFAAPATQP